MRKKDTMAKEVETVEEKIAREAREQQAAEVRAKADSTNSARNGKGTRIAVGSTRGRSTFSFPYEAFDKSLPETLPSTVAEAMTLMDITDDDSGASKMVSLLIEGYNLVSETNASDPVSEFVDATWPEDFQKRFKIVIKNYAENSNVSIQDAVELLKPGMQKGYEAQLAAAKAASLVSA